MAVSLLQCWLDHYDPIHRGWTPEGIANGVCSTNGFFFPRIRGGYNLRRAEGSVPDASAVIVGAAGADTESIHTFGWVTHQGGHSYLYRLTAVNGGGVENWSDELTTDVAFYVSGSWKGCRPNSPSDLRVTPLAGGKFLLRWTYSPEGEIKAPDQFNIHTDDGSGSVDFTSIYDAITYRQGQLHYESVTGSYLHGTRVQWAVRAEASSPVVEDENTRIVAAEAQATGPPINPVVLISRE